MLKNWVLLGAQAFVDAHPSWAKDVGLGFKF